MAYNARCIRIEPGGDVYDDLPERPQMSRVVYFMLVVALLAVCAPWRSRSYSTSAWGQEETTQSASSSDEGEGEAEEEPPSRPLFNLYISPLWLALFILFAVVWVLAMDWVNRDAVGVGENFRVWNLIVYLVGALGLFLFWKSGPGYMVFMAVMLLGAVGTYVYFRNQKVPANYRLFTREWFTTNVPKLLSRLGIERPMVGVGGGREDHTRIILTRKDGTTAAAMTQGRRSQHSEAIVACKEITENAIQSRATDIHLEPKGSELQVRYRIDGILHNATPYPAEIGRSIISAIKVLADMDIAERRRSQDGSFSATLDGQTFDVRAATGPSVHGETMVLRLLDSSGGVLKNGLAGLGFTPETLRMIQGVVHSPHGCFITTGPTGSGKTTTLYAALSEIDAYQRNIITIENPIEYRLDNVTQTPINPEAGVTFASTLRAVLRQDPDVIMVGEIRDGETARTALQAAMTGHFVFTTLHANDAVTSLIRLLDLGIEVNLVESALSCICAQRLVRVLCPECKVPYTPNAEFLQKIGVSPDKVQEFYKAKGCEECQGTGYRGRTGIYEVLMMTDGIRDLLREKPTVTAIKQEARRNGLVTLQEDGLRKVVQGITSIKEIIRVTK